jgi:hypothetical protein
MSLRSCIFVLCMIRMLKLDLVTTCEYDRDGYMRFLSTV